MTAFTADVPISAVTVLLQGLISFFSPCVLPLIPLYISYLAGDQDMNASAGRARARTFINTLFFVFGIGAAFFLLGLGMTAIGHFFSGNRNIIMRAGGIFIMIMGLYQLGVFGMVPFLNQERKLPDPTGSMGMSPLAAWIMGFVFSFGWTPCVGPALSSVLMMAAAAETASTGFLYIGLYTLGFAVPFLIVGLFTSSVLSYIKKHRGFMHGLQKAGAVLLIMIGILMFTGVMSGISGGLAKLGGGAGTPAVTEDIAATEESESETETAAAETVMEAAENEPAVETTAAETTAESTSDNSAAATESSDDGSAAEDSTENAAAESSDDSAAAKGSTNETAAEASDDSTAAETSTDETASDAARHKVRAPEFTLLDQYGATHTLDDYKGKVIFLNFWATWCPPCRSEMPDIEQLYQKYSADPDSEVAILGIAAPEIGGEEDVEGIAAFLSENGYTYPVIMDEGGALSYEYAIQAYPTTFMIDKEGYIYGYLTGMMDLETMESIIERTLNGE